MEVQQFVLVAVQEPTYFSLTKKLFDIQYSKSMNTSCEDYASTHIHTNSKESQDPYQQKVLFLRLSIPYISI